MLLYKGVAAVGASPRVPMQKAAAVATSRFLGLMAVFLLPVPVLAQAVINVPRDQPTIQAGINAANDGDTVLVAPGKYVENIDFQGKAITVTSSGSAANTILDGGAAGPVVTFGSAETRASVISGMTIQNGGGFGSNTSTFGIAGVVIFGSSPTIQNNIITQNQCWDIEVLYGGPLIQGNTISSTVSPAGGCGTGSGAGISVNGNLDDDISTSDGSAAIITGNTIENITIPAAVDASQAFTNLDSENGGAGIAVLDGSPLIENNIIRNNSAPGGNGGGINIAGGTGATIAQNLIYGNSAGCGGGAISFNETDTGKGPYLLVTNNTIVDNTGGSADLYSSCGNVSQIYSVNFGLSSPNVIFVNNIVSGNSAAPAVGCYILPTTPSEAEQSIFDHNLLYNASGDFFGPTCVDVSAKYGNMVAAPQFANPAQGDYHLLQGSPGIDIGNNSALGDLSQLSGTTLATAFDGNSRVQDATGVGYPIIDMGAYELKGTVDGSPTTIVLTSSTYAGAPGAPFTVEASVQSALGVPTGNIVFYLDGQQIGMSAINSLGDASLSSAVPGVGAHSLYASYAGADSFTAARSVIIIVTGVGPPASETYTTNLVIGANIPVQTVGMDETFTIIGTSSDPNPAFSPSPITLTVNQGAVIASVTPGKEGTSTFSTKTLPVGEDVITASYAGDATHQASTASTTVDIQAVSTSLIMQCEPRTIFVGQTSMLSVTVNATSGSVMFLDNKETLGEVPVVNGTATWTYLARTMGEHDVVAVYPAFGPPSGEADCYAPGMPPPYPFIIVEGLASASTLTINPATGPYLTPTTMTATISPASPPGFGTPTGTVDFFMNGSTFLGTANVVAGVATFSTTMFPAGMNSVTCVYQGDRVYIYSNCNTVPFTRSADQTVLTVAASANDIPALTPVTFSVELLVSGQPVASRPVVMLSAGGQTYPLPLEADGTAAVVVSDLLPGTYPVTATFPGNMNLLSATASLTETVVTTSSATALSVAPSPGYAGQPVTITAMVTAPDTLVPAGATVTFYDGTAMLGTAVLDQTRTATFTTSSLAVGTHSLTASYPGTNVFVGSTSPPVDETILASSFTITLSPATVTVPADQKTTVAIQLASVGGFAGPLTLSYGVLPVNASATILPLSVTLTAGGDGSSTLTLNTATRTPTTMSRRTKPRGTAEWPVFLATTLFLLFPWRWRLRVNRPSAKPGARLLIWLALATALLQTATGCGNSFYTLPGVAPGTYQIPITATDIHQNTQTAMLTLVVPPQ